MISSLIINLILVFTSQDELNDLISDDDDDTMLAAVLQQASPPKGQPAKAPQTVSPVVSQSALQTSIPTDTLSVLTSRKQMYEAGIQQSTMSSKVCTNLVIV